MKQELEVFNILEPIYHLAKNVRDKRIGNVIVNHVQVSDLKNILKLDHLKLDKTSPLVNCEWNEWGKWGLCSATCGGGQQFRIRTKKQIAQNGGQDCIGQSQDWSRTCNEDVCPSEW